MLSSFAAWMRQHKVELGLGVRVTVAALSALAVAFLLNLKLPLLLLPTMHQVSALESAIDRVLEVAVGAVVGLIVSFVVLPSRAHEQIRNGIAHVLELMASVLSELLSSAMVGQDKQELHRLQDGIGQTLGSLAAIGVEAERERAAHLSSGADTGPLLRTVLRLRHDMVAIGRANVTPLPREL